MLMDEACGRKLALQAGLIVIGTLGILLRAKTLGLCFEIRPLLDSLQDALNFFIAPSLRKAVLKQADEGD